MLIFHMRNTLTANGFLKAPILHKSLEISQIDFLLNHDMWVGSQLFLTMMLLLMYILLKYVCDI